MIDHKIKKNIRLLAEKYGYSISYPGEAIVLQKDNFNIKILLRDKYTIDVAYSDGNHSDSTGVETLYVYHVILKLFDFENYYALLKWGYGKLLTMQDYYKEENFNEKEITNQLNALKATNAEYKEFGGNLISVEYYKGVLILTDDLNFYNWNVIEWV